MQFHNALTGTITIGELPIKPAPAPAPKARTGRPATSKTRPRIIPVDPALLDNCAILDREAHEEIGPENSPFVATLTWLDSWVTDYNDCPGLATLLETLDRAGIGHSFDLRFWLDRWRRA